VKVADFFARTSGLPLQSAAASNAFAQPGDTVSDPLEPILETRFVLGPNASLSVRGAWAFMLSVSLATLGAATWCAVHGFWPVLPFAGLELAAVGWALVVSMRRNRYREVVSFGPDRVRIEFGVVGQGVAAQVELPRAWTRAWIERDSGRRHAPTRLLLGSSGQRVVVGRCLTDEEREALAARFGTLLKVRRGSLDGRTSHSGMTLGEG
jgi:uncharacterized membrane protein